ncbi:MAG: tetratricopeptide repeat protein, partial [Candidatus Omnitrophota bacterium]
HFSFSKKIRFKIFLPVLVLCVFMVGIRQMAIKQIFFNLFYSGVLFRRVPGFFDAIWNYLGILLLPMGLHMERGNRFFVFTDPGVVLGITVTIILLAGSFIIRKRGSLIFFFTWWFFIAFIPSTSIFPVLAFYMAEHWLYFPALGFFALLAMGLNSFYTKNRAAAAIISAALLLFYSISTIAQNRVWKDKIVFYEYCLKFSPESGSILSNLGTAYLEAGRYADAVKFCSQAVAVNPDFAVYRCNLGRAYLKTGDRDKAKREFEQAIMFGPYCEYPHLCMGEYYMAIGKAQEAIAAFEYAVKLSPNYIQGYLKLSEAYAALSNYEEAGKARKKALQLGGRKI